MHRPRQLLTLPALVMLGVLGVACGVRPTEMPLAIGFVDIPEAGQGGSDRLSTISGRVTGARPGDRIVLFAKGGIWWLQPFTAEPFTEIAADGSWRNRTHLGTDYAAVLVDASYQPPVTLDELPQPGSGVRLVASVPGSGDFLSRPKPTLSFSGYEWEIRERPSDRGGSNEFDPANAWVDAEGFLHLKVANRVGQWTSAEVTLTRALGYGTYSFVVRDAEKLPAAAAMGLFTWDDEAAAENHRELAVELSQWGAPTPASAQYVVQPYYVAANVFRFSPPGGRLTHAFRWEPGRAAFSTYRGSTTSGRPLAQHDFTSGVPGPGNERVRMNLYYFRFSSTPLETDAEVVVEKFEYLP